MNLLTKLIKQKNTLFLFATCIAVSCMASQCESCKSVPVKEDNKVTMKLTPASGIKDDEVATFKLQQTAGATILGDVVLTITNYAAFVTQDGRALAATMKLNEFLGKPAEEKMGDTAIDLSVKATTATQAGTNDQKLKIAVGNNTDAAAYVIETDVVTWKAQAVFLILAPSPVVTNHANEGLATIVVQKNGTAPSLKYEEVSLTFGGNSNKFCYGPSDALGAAITLADFLNNPNTLVNPTDYIPNTPINLDVYGIRPGVSNGDKLTLAIGKLGDPNCYLDVTDVVTWQEPTISLVGGITALTGFAPGTFEFKITDAPIRSTAVTLVFRCIEDGYYEYKNSVGNFVGCKHNQEVKLSDLIGAVVDKTTNFEITLKVKPGSVLPGPELKLEIHNTTNPGIIYMANTQIVSSTT